MAGRNNNLLAYRRWVIAAVVACSLMLLVKGVDDASPQTTRADTNGVSVDEPYMAPSAPVAVPSVDPVEPHEPATEMRDTVPYFLGLDLLVPSIDGVVEMHFELAAEGNAASNMEIAYALRGCDIVQGIVDAQDPETSMKVMMSAIRARTPANSKLLELVERSTAWLLPQCQAAARYRPENLDHEHWKKTHFDAAVAAGEPLTSFESAFWHARENGGDRELIGRKLEAALRTGHPRALSFVSLYYANEFAAFETLEIELALSAFWLQSCIRHVMCDTGIARANLALEHLPAEVERIEAMAELIDERLADPTPMNLSDPINIDLERWDALRVPASG